MSPDSSSIPRQPSRMTCVCSSQAGAGGINRAQFPASRHAMASVTALVFVSGSSKFPLEDMQDKSKETLRIFVLADTHNRLPGKVKEMAQDADEIWHLGDVCAETILHELRAIGHRVTVVRGNCDSNFEWPLVIDLVHGGLKFRLQHVPPSQPPDDADVLLHGHTHVPRNERRGRVLFLNPGCVYAAKPWFARERSMA